MRGASRKLRWGALFALFSLIATYTLQPIVGDFVVGVARKTGLLDEAPEWALSAMNVATAFVQLPWVISTMACLAAFAAGAWLDAVMRKFDSRWSREVSHLGLQATQMANRISKFQSRDTMWAKESPDDIKADILPLLLKFEKFGFVVPPMNEPAQLEAYLRVVGPLLREGHIKEAQLVASEIISAS